MSGTYLQSEKNRLLDRIAQIRATGPVAEAYLFLATITTTSKTGKTYEYARLVFQKRSTDEQKVKQQLGRVGSEEHRYWQRAISRRNAIVELEQQLRLLTDLIERQQKHRELTEQSVEEPE